MTNNSAVDVAIMGREFRVTCPDEEREELLQAVTYLDKKMCEIRDNGKVVGSERIAIMAGLNIAHAGYIHLKDLVIRNIWQKQ